MVGAMETPRCPDLLQKQMAVRAMHALNRGTLTLSAVLRPCWPGLLVPLAATLGYHSVPIARSDLLSSVCLNSEGDQRRLQLALG